MLSVLCVAIIVGCAGAAPSAPSTHSAVPCLFDGRVYQAGETIMIAKCLATMVCLGNNNYGDMKSLGGVCPEKRQSDDLYAGCLFDGKVYKAGDKIMIKPCLAEMTCEGHNIYSNPLSLGGVCPSKKRETNGQLGCLFDGYVYGAGEKIMIPSCLGEMTCLGRNNYSPISSYGGVCPEKRNTDGQTGCNFDGSVYKAGETVYVKGCLAKFACLGYNRISEPISLGGVC